MTLEALRSAIEKLAGERSPSREESLPVFAELLDALERGAVRAAEPDGEVWKVHAWVKQGILLGFRVGENRAVAMPPVFHFRDRDTFGTWSPASTSRDVRIVPGGTVVRRGAFLGDGVVVMPPAFINVGAYVGAGSMIDSHALVGSCAQVGTGVHLSAAAQVGGVLEPIGSSPVILEDGVFVGGGCGIYEGTRVRAGAVLGSGVVLTRGVVLVDLVHEIVYRAEPGAALVVPARAVVVPGAREASGEFARRHGIHLSTPVIVKYKDAKTDAASALEEALR